VKYLAWLCLVYALLAVEAPLQARLDLPLLAPDVSLILALYLGSRAPFVPGLLVSFGAGLLKDGFVLAAPVGVFTETAVLAFLAAGFMARRVDLRSTVPVMASAASASLLATALFLGLESVFHRGYAGHGEALTMALPLALGTMLLAPLLFAAFDRTGRWFDTRTRTRYLSG
jgi:hypothetical protein